MDNYLTIYIDSAFSEQGPLAFLALVLLFMGRMLPIIAQAPFFGARVLPHPVKIAFAISLFAIYFPTLVTLIEKPLLFNHYLVLLFLKELLVGLLLGFFVSIPFIAVQTAGMVIDHQRGGASLMVNDPTIQNQSSPLGTMFNLTLIYVFFLVDAPFLVINAIYRSYEIIPPDRFFNPNFFNMNTPYFKILVGIFGQMMQIAAQLASPALLAILMTDVFLGIANRLAPQVQITFLGLPLKSLLALAAVCFGWQLFVGQLIRESFKWLEQMNQSMEFFRLE